jgi:serine/threonine-protein kinase
MTEPEIVGGRYELGELLGRGGMAEVRKGVDRRLGRIVAIKRLRTDLASDATFQTRFRREAQSAAALNHPTIVAVYDTGEETVHGQTVPYIVMEYVEGRTLRDVLRSGESLLPERTLEIVSDVLRALSYSHHAGIVHRDIKPANVMLTPTGDVKVMDFGIARAVADTSATVTQTAAVIGTAQYLSPEQARGAPVDARSDIYSTGCLLYELLTGRPPFTGDSPVSVAYQHVREDPIPPSRVNSAITPTIDQIVLRALAKDPADRYQSADEMRADLQRALRGERTAAAATVIAPQATQAIPRVDAPPPIAYTAPAAGAAVPPPAQPPEDDRRRSGATGWVIGILTVILLAVLGFIGYQIAKGNGEDQVAVPNIVGKSEGDARQLVEAQGLRLATCDPQPNETIESGIITGQDPVAEAKADRNSEVSCTVSAGRAETTVPQLENLTQEQAEAALTQAHLTLGEVTTANSDKPEGVVISSNPGAGTGVAEGTAVDLVVSNGQQSVPNVVSLPEADATTILRNAGFNVQREEEESTATPGTVIRQDPAPNQVVANDSTVTITVAIPPSTPTPTTGKVPDVTGDTLEEATAAIEEAGFHVAAVDSSACDNETDPTCVVDSQDPKGGTEAELGTPVDLVMRQRGGGDGGNQADQGSVLAGGAVLVLFGAGALARGWRREED